ncbi:MAG: hypothetical protein ACI91B_003816, partial [Planctomycetota bacterium]
GLPKVGWVMFCEQALLESRLWYGARHSSER